MTTPTAWAVAYTIDHHGTLRIDHTPYPTPQAAEQAADQWRRRGAHHATIHPLTQEERSA